MLRIEYVTVVTNRSFFYWVLGIGCWVVRYVGTNTYGCPMPTIREVGLDYLPLLRIGICISELPRSYSDQLLEISTKLRRR